MCEFGRYIRFSLILCVAANIHAEQNVDRADEALQFIDGVQNQLKLTNQKNIILLVGITGSGKSTLTHYVAGNFSRMNATESPDDEDEFIIYDGMDPNIGQAISTTVSRTLVPEMVVDEDNHVWYDCPGFADTRNTTVEIATSFLIQSVIENAVNVKIVLVVNYGGVTKSNDRLYLPKLLDHTLQLIPKIERYLSSVSIVISKVDPYRANGVPTTEAKVKKSVAKFLNEYRNELAKNEPNSAKVLLIDTLLNESSNGDFTRIGIFWKPTEANSFDQIDRMVEGRKHIRDVILQQTIYTEVRENDFGSPLTDTARLTIGEIIKFLTDDINRLFRTMDEEMRLQLQTIISSRADWLERMKLLKTLMQRSRDAEVNNQTISSLVDELSALANQLNITSVSDEMKRMLRDEQNLRIFRSIIRSGEVFSIAEHFSTTLTAMRDYMKSEYEWSALLARLFANFAKYEAQRNVSEYLPQLNHRDRDHEYHIDESNFTPFVKHFSDIDYGYATPSRLKELNGIIRFTLNADLSIEYNAETATIRGNFLKSSDVKRIRCPSGVSSIQVFAAHTFFVDCDLSLARNLNIFANKWEVRGNFTFDLSGDDGESLPSNYGSGTPGSPGNSGSNGRSFFGFAEEIINGHLLTVDTSGGNGGRGQDGTSAPDKSVHIPSEYSIGYQTGLVQSSFRDILRDHLTMNNEQRVDVYVDDRYEHYMNILVFGKGTISNKFNVYLYECCGSNGLGGSGGLAGTAGKSQFIGTHGAYPQFITMNGIDGMGGRDSIPCSTTMARVQTTSKYRRILEFVAFHTDFYATYGQQWGCQNQFRGSTENPKLAHSVEQLQAMSSVIEYKTYLRRAMLDFPNIKSIREQYDVLHSNGEINEMFTAADLAMDAIALEKQYFTLKNGIDMMPFYSQLMMQIEIFRDKLKQDSSQATERHLVSLLYAQTLSRTVALKHEKESDLIIDIDAYFDLVLNNINDLEQLTNVRTIDQYRTNYKQTIDAKTTEGLDFIQNGIQNQIQNLFRSLDGEVHTAINDVVTAKAQTVADIKTKKSNLQKVQRNMFVNIFVGILNTVKIFVGGYASMVNPLLGILVGENRLHKRSTAHFTGNGIKPHILLDFLRENDQEKLRAIETQLSYLNYSFEPDEMSDHPEVNEKLNKMFSVAKEIISKGPSAFIHDEVETLFDEFKGFVNEQIGMLAGPIIDSLRNVSKTLSVVESSPTFYRQYMDQSDKIEVIGTAMASDQQKLKKLHNLQAAIYNDLLPTFIDLERSLRITSHDLDHKSSIALSIQKAKIQQQMQIVQKRLSDTMNGVELVSHAGIKDCLLNVHEAMNLVIDIYNRIQSYKEQSDLVDYLAAINAPNFRQSVLNDPKLTAIITELKFNLQTNILLSQYDRIFDAVKQAVFPYASNYLDIYRLPAEHLTEQNTTAFLVTAVDNIKSLRGRIDELNATVINRDDADIHLVESQAFMVWPNNEIQDQIRRLFAGEKVYLFADVRRNSKQNAVKFNSVRIEFRTDHQTRQTKFENILQSFDVILTHMGDSHYRCDKQFYTITSSSQQISYSIRTHSQSQMPLRRNAVYEKINTGVALLSPYALWSVQLTDGPFEQLAPFADVVDIELHGRGSYVSDNAEICDSELNHYYSVYY